jgi:hypothetical protein
LGNFKDSRPAVPALLYQACPEFDIWQAVAKLYSDYAAY